MRRLPACSLAAAAACLGFWIAGHALIPHLGVQHDETLFVEGIYPPRADYSIQAGGWHVPVMLMTYVGALKAWIYWPILHLFGAGLGTLRNPALLMGTASIWLFFLLLRRVSGERAALIGCWLLAADSMYLVTLCFDWGPVALQHLLTVAGVYLLVRFAQDGSQAAMAGGCFLLGLALWDKALAVWMLSGLAVAAVVVCRMALFRLITWRRAAVAFFSFTLGALPLIYYNAANSFVTFRDNVHSEAVDVAGKAGVLKDTAGGDGLFGWLTAEDSQTPRPHAPQGLIEKASAKVSAWTGHPRRSLLLYAFVLALLAVPFAGRASRAVVGFCLIAMTVAWVQMAFTANAGASVHHTILLWPLPVAVVAVSFAGCSLRAGRWGTMAVGGLVAILVIGGGLVMNEYYAVMVRNGGAQNWNDGILSLSSYLQGVPARRVMAVDWGILDPLRFLNGGTLPLEPADDQGSIADPENLFVGHTAAFTYFPDRSQRLLQLAAAAGYEREVTGVISDSLGRATYEVFRFRKIR